MEQLTETGYAYFEIQRSDPRFRGIVTHSALVSDQQAVRLDGDGKFTVGSKAAIMAQYDVEDPGMTSVEILGFIDNEDGELSPIFYVPSKEYELLRGTSTMAVLAIGAGDLIARVYVGRNPDQAKAARDFDQQRRGYCRFLENNSLSASLI